MVVSIGIFLKVINKVDELVIKNELMSSAIFLEENASFCIKR